MTLKTDFGTYENCFLFLSRYVYDSSIAIQVWNEEEGHIATLTKCIADQKLTNFERSFVDVNNCSFAEKFINEYQLGTRMGVSLRSGFCDYPLYKFDIRTLKKYERTEEE